jgi:hypothetical protein
MLRTEPFPDGTCFRMAMHNTHVYCASLFSAWVAAWGLRGLKSELPLPALARRRAPAPASACLQLLGADEAGQQEPLLGLLLLLLLLLHAEQRLVAELRSAARHPAMRAPVNPPPVACTLLPAAQAASPRSASHLPWLASPDG